MLRCSSSQNLACASRDFQATAVSSLASERNLLHCSTSYSVPIATLGSGCRSAGRGLRSNSSSSVVRQGPATHARAASLPLAARLSEAVVVAEEAEAVSPSVQPLGSPEQVDRRKSAWNKGRKVSERTKLKISLAQKLRYNRNPELRKQIGEKLKGKEAWNKGRTLSAETRQKMREAKLNRPLAKAVRRKMSKAHMGKSHTQATGMLLSAKLGGLPKSTEHRLNIAASQRRRHAASRVLQAVEAVHREASTEGRMGTPQLPPSLSRGYSRKKDGAKLGGGVGNCNGGAPSRVTRSQYLEPYKAELREYRALQEELGHWTRAFEEQHGRKPRLRDVELTGIDWLLEKYKKYMVLRERVLSDTQGLRSMLSGARPDGDASEMAMMMGGGGMTGGMAGGGLRSAANAVPVGAGGGATSRLAAALDYKRAKDGSGGGARPAAATTLGAAAASAPPSMAAAALSTTNGSASAALPAGLTKAPPRVKAAMMAALEYRQKKAAATAAQANAAAAAARQPPPSSARAAAKRPAAAASLSRGVSLGRAAVAAPGGGAGKMQGPRQVVAAAGKPPMQQQRGLKQQQQVQQQPLDVTAAQYAAAAALLEAQDAERGMREALQAMALERQSEIGEERMAAA